MKEQKILYYYQADRYNDGAGTGSFMEKELKDTQELVFDLTDLEYISSAGLRVLLKVQKYMNKKGDFKLTHVSEVIEEIFEITGFSDILTIE